MGKSKTQVHEPNLGPGPPEDLAREQRKKQRKKGVPVCTEDTLLGLRLWASW
jgi:hypothetical protein